MWRKSEERVADIWFQTITFAPPTALGRNSIQTQRPPWFSHTRDGLLIPFSPNCRDEAEGTRADKKKKRREAKHIEAQTRARARAGRRATPVDCMNNQWRNDRGGREGSSENVTPCLPGMEQCQTIRFTEPSGRVSGLATKP